MEEIETIFDSAGVNDFKSVYFYFLNILDLFSKLSHDEFQLLDLNSRFKVIEPRTIYCHCTGWKFIYF